MTDVASLPASLAPPRPRLAAAPIDVPEIDIVIPVYNEEGDLDASVGAAAGLPERHAPLHLPDHRGRQRQHRRHVGDRTRPRAAS